jgi:hypothetical protein
MGPGAKSYLWTGFLINEKMRKYFPIYEEAASHISLQLLHSEFPYIWGEFIFLFYQCGEWGGRGVNFKEEKINFYDRREQKNQQVALEVGRKHLNVSESLSISKKSLPEGGITK